MQRIPYAALKSLSLFSGIGGFDLGFQRAGIECVAVCEIDRNAQSILRRHFPKAELFDDVRKVCKATHERKSIDIICGGFPCQDVSIAGKRAGLAGERSGLWFEFARVIDELEPQWVVIENVPGLLSSNGGRDFAVIIRWLAQRGYGVAWRVLDAQYFGVPQQRRRVFVIGSFGDGRAAEILFEQEGSCGDTPPSREAEKDVAPTIGSVSNGGGANGPGRDVDSVESLVIAPSRSVAETLTGQNHTGLGGGVTNKSIPNLVMAHGQANAEIVIDGSPSMTTNHEAPILGGVRRLMPIECERLQGFPDGWTDGQSDSVRYRQLGNAVAVPVAEWIAKRITAATYSKEIN
jgi:DNA (cytosine-5)-methyltransferase 1